MTGHGNWLSRTRNIDADQVQVTVEDSGPGLDPNTMQAGSLTLSTPPSPAAWAWDSRSAVPFFRTMAAGYGLRPMTAQAQASTSPFRSTTKKDHMQESQESDAIIAIVDDDPSVRRGSAAADPVSGVEGRDLRLRAGIPGPRAELRRQVVWCWTCNCRV